jgi:hypothetical protein
MENVSEQQARLILERFQQRASDVPKILGALSTVDINRYPALKNKYYALLRQGRAIMDKNEKHAQDIKKAYGFGRGVVGLQGSELGFLPLLIWGAIAASTAVTSKFAYDAYSLNQQASEIDKLVAQGMTREQANNIVAGQNSWIVQVGKNIVLPVASVAAFAFIVSRILKRGKKG